MMASLPQNLMDRINNIDIDDLEYAERDLCFYELVSLGFLLYGREKTTSEYILQKLIVLQQNPPEGKGDATASSDILRKYAATVVQWLACPPCIHKVVGSIPATTEHQKVFQRWIIPPQ
ncbi:caspase-8-like [Haematobia irritans]|uniref:caspase-8-like n=1 Tax=Haematobia irritans TaxID=7368 RepID=UPI003F4FE789